MAYRRPRSSSSSFSASARERLHYFTLPEDGLDWGATRQLRCMKLNRSLRNFNLPRSLSAPVTDQSRVVGNELTAVAQNQESAVSPANSGHRVNSMGDLQEGVEGMRVSMVEDKGKGKEKASEDDSGENRSAGAKTWNLRTRRSACKAPQGNGGDEMMLDAPAAPIVGSGGGGNGDVLSPMRRIDGRLRGGGGTGSGVEPKMEMPKFTFSLTKEEIEEDFLAMTGAKPPKKPMRRPRGVQRKLNDLVPGLWLGEVTPESYKVDDNPKSRKGLK